MEFNFDILHFGLQNALPVPDCMKTVSHQKQERFNPYLTVWMEMGTLPVLSWRNFRP
jgi:hypothetical protein